MRILLVNTSESTGGAAVACRRLLDAFNAVEGVSATMLVRDKQTSRKDVVALPSPKWKQQWNFVWERFVIWAKNGFSRKHLFAVDIANAGDDITKLPEFKQADVIHLHWVNQGMLSLAGIRKILASGKPVVWTMHDMWPCTGICHHARECECYAGECHDCPYLRFRGENDLSTKVFLEKQEVYNTARFFVVAVSNWLAKLVERSALLRNMPLFVIPNTLSPEDFRLHDRQVARSTLKLPADKKIVLFGAARLDDPIKGIQYLFKALALLKARSLNSDKLHLVLFGTIKNSKEVLPNIPVPYTHLGLVNDVEMLSKLYSAADVLVSASFYETFGQTLIEAQACGCIPVSFGNSGQKDIIGHKKNGYLADYLSAESLADGIAWVLEEGEEEISREEMRRDVIARFSPQVVARQYITVYENALRIRET